MQMRKDALLGCARMIEGVNRVGLEHAPLAVSTVGLMEVRPNSRNVIPGSVFFTIDLRHPEDEVLATMDAEFRQMVSGVAADAGLEVELSEVYAEASMEFDRTCIALVRGAAEKLGYSYREIVSGPGHDAVYIARVAPTAMVFIPCEGGISHSEAENAKPEDVEAGANVLLHAVLARDEFKRVYRVS
jgi:N-carbamoyl-L-amino-acid hydrolase